MKNIIAIFLCLTLLFALTVPVSAAGTVHMSISGGGSAYRGDTLNFSISVSGGGSCASFGLYLSYDSSVFEYVGGSASAGGALVSSMSSNGLVVSYNGEGTPSGTVASFSLRVKSGAPFGTFSVSGSASANGASASASGTSVKVLCNHSFGDWQQYSENYHQKTCSICGGTQEEGHGWNEGTVLSQPSCKDEGSKSFVCTVCGASKTEVLSKTNDHVYGAWQRVDDTNHRATCSVCSDILTEAHTWDNGTVTKAETCKDTGTMHYTCTSCGATRDEIIPISDNHKYSAWTKVDDAKHQHTCPVCNKQEIVDHDWNGGSVTKKPNCIETGSCIYTCNSCGTTKTEEMPLTGIHTYDHGCDKDCNICGATRTTSHDYSDNWSKNAKEHWRVCNNCGAKKDQQAHIPGPEATEFNPQVCTTCDYILHPELAHEHKYAEELTSDESGHWYACVGCEEQKDYVEHDYTDACDGECETCGYTRQVAHEISEAWYADFVNHFQKCELCGKTEEPIRHTPGPNATEMAPQVCEICGYELMPALGHRFSEDWHKDETNHYHLCACGEKADIAQHDWDAGIKDPDGTLFTCTVCGQQYLQPRDLTWLIYVAVGVMAVAGGLVVFLKKKKSQTAE